MEDDGGEGGADALDWGDHWATDGEGELVVDEAVAVWWDVVEFEAAYSERPAERASGEDEVCCRICGLPVGGGRAGLMAHLGTAHGVGVDSYHRRFPAAPLAPPENELDGGGPPGLRW